MTYSIFDNGNLVVSFDREDEAREALARLAGDSRSVQDDFVLAVFDDAGNLVEDRRPRLGP